jgi:hypothetical protein
VGFWKKTKGPLKKAISEKDIILHGVLVFWFFQEKLNWGIKLKCIKWLELTNKFAVDWNIKIDCSPSYQKHKAENNSKLKEDIFLGPQERSQNWNLLPRISECRALICHICFLCCLKINLFFCRCMFWTYIICPLFRAM